MPMTKASVATMTAWMRQVAMRIFLRSWRSTKTPASSPMIRLGMAVTIRVKPTASADSVCAVDVDAGSEVRQRRAGGRDELRQPQQGEVPPPEHGEHGWGRRARDAHRTSTGAGDGARPSPRSRRSGSHDDTGSGGVYWPRRATVTPSRRSIASLRRQLPVAVDPAVTPVAPERAVRGDHPVARDTSEIGLRPSAPPTARDARGAPTRRAISP